MGQHLVILTRGIDLSVGSNLALATVDRRAGLPGGRLRAARHPGDARQPAPLVGAVNGVVYVFGRLPHPFIITLATLSICRGLALALAVNHTTMRGMPDAIAWLGGVAAFGMPELLLRRRRRGARAPGHDQGDGLGPLDLRGRRRPEGGGRDGHPGQGRAGFDVRDLRALRRHRRGGARRPHRRRLAALRQPARTRHASPPSSSAARASSAAAATSATRWSAR